MGGGKVILLNGVSGSGKTTLARELQKQSEELLFRVSVDDFCHMLPAKSMCMTNIERGIDVMFRTVRTICESGFSVVVDAVILAHMNAWNALMEHLDGIPVLLVRVQCPSGELLRRETQRGDRSMGQGEAQLAWLFPGAGYELVVDTFERPCEECSVRILAELDSARPLDPRGYPSLERAREGVHSS
ncbi:MAG: AAA family ATPase [Clostridia bacterium]|nr:AAA family ATPase [Clostridia bacterium]